jgi:3-oxoacyl-[acyl-carrier-protein] synthase II
LRRAFDAAGSSPLDRDVQVVLGTSLGAYLEQPPDQSLYGWVDAVAAELGLPVSPIALSTACSSGSDAILVGAALIRAGKARCCICGGVDVLTWSKRLGHSSLGTMSPTFLRAFDQRHDGTLLGEGAGFIAIESSDTARTPLAILRGCGASNDAVALTAADVSGRCARLAMERSLADAGLSAKDVGLINAHGSGTLMNDATEKSAIGDLFPASPGPIVFATKGNFGHSLGATGALEAIALVQALRSGQVPPIVGLDDPDPQFPLQLARGEPTSHIAKIGLSLTLGFGGFDTSLIFEAA